MSSLLTWFLRLSSAWYEATRSATCRRIHLPKLKEKGIEELTRKFLTDTDDTGRFIVTSKRTGRIYYVEPIGAPKTKWGDITTYGAGGTVTGSYGQKHRGSIDASESLITPEHGFADEKIYKLDPGVSPLLFIDKLDSEYPDKTAAK